MWHFISSNYSTNVKRKCYVPVFITRFQGNGDLAVHFVDYGNCFVAPRASALALPDSAIGIPPLAFPVSLDDEAFVIPTGSLDSSTVAQLTVETPTYNIKIPVSDTPSAAPLPPSKRSSINAVIKDAVKTLNVLDVLAAAGIVKLRAVQSPSPAAVKAAPVLAAAPAPEGAKFSADSVPPCPFVPEVGETKKVIVTEVMTLNQIYVQVNVDF